MTLREHLDEFYRIYNIPANGGINDKTFEVPLPYITLTLPNLSWRKKMLYIHDLEHILNEQTTNWDGEIFIASWEISTGFWKHFPIIIFPLWTMGWGLWKHPTSVFRGFRKGNSDQGIAGLNIHQEQLLAMDLPQLKLLTQNKNEHRSSTSFYSRLAYWVVISQIIFLSPTIAIFASLAFILH